MTWQRCAAPLQMLYSGEQEGPLLPSGHCRKGCWTRPGMRRRQELEKEQEAGEGAGRRRRGRRQELEKGQEVEHLAREGGAIVQAESSLAGLGVTDPLVALLNISPSPGEKEKEREREKEKERKKEKEKEKEYMYLGSGTTGSMSPPFTTRSKMQPVNPGMM